MAGQLGLKRTWKGSVLECMPTDTERGRRSMWWRLLCETLTLQAYTGRPSWSVQTTWNCGGVQPFSTQNSSSNYNTYIHTSTSLSAQWNDQAINDITSSRQKLAVVMKPPPPISAVEPSSPLTRHLQRYGYRFSSNNFQLKLCQSAADRALWPTNLTFEFKTVHQWAVQTKDTSTLLFSKSPIIFQPFWESRKVEPYGWATKTILRSYWWEAWKQ